MSTDISSSSGFREGIRGNLQRAYGTQGLAGGRGALGAAFSASINPVPLTGRLPIGRGREHGAGHLANPR
jgi:hypothetical protein